MDLEDFFKLEATLGMKNMRTERTPQKTNTVNNSSPHENTKRKNTKATTSESSRRPTKRVRVTVDRKVARTAETVAGTDVQLASHMGPSILPKTTRDTSRISKTLITTPQGQAQGRMSTQQDIDDLTMTKDDQHKDITNATVSETRLPPRIAPPKQQQSNDDPERPSTRDTNHPPVECGNASINPTIQPTAPLLPSFRSTVADFLRRRSNILFSTDWSPAV